MFNPYRSMEDDAELLLDGSQDKKLATGTRKVESPSIAAYPTRADDEMELLSENLILGHEPA